MGGDGANKQQLQSYPFLMTWIIPKKQHSIKLPYSKYYEGSNLKP